MSNCFLNLKNLSLIVLLSLLSACGGGSSDNSETPNSQQNTPNNTIEIVDFYPSHEANDIATTAVISVSFNQTITASTIDVSLVDLSANQSVEGSITIENTTLTFTPTNTLEPNNVYEFTLNTTLNISNQSPPWRFTTQVSDDSLARIVTHYPAKGQQDVPVDIDILITLSSVLPDIDISSLVTLFHNNEEVSGKATLTGDQITFIPQSPLVNAEEYVFSIMPDDSLQSVIAPYQFTFTTAESTQPIKRNIHPTPMRYGETTFTLMPTEHVVAGALTKVSFGIPFPKNVISNLTQFRILDEQNNEIPIATTMLLPWRETAPSEESIRSALVQLEVTFEADEFSQLLPKTFTLVWGEERTTEDLSLTSAEADWILVNDDEFPASDKIFEPSVYAVFTPQWYGKSVIKTRLLPTGSHPDFSAYDTAFQLFGDTTINHVDPRVLNDNLIPYRNSYAAWLFDRAMAIYQLAFKTGEFKYLRSAHRASQFYLQHINDQGYFSLKSSNDMKYSYGESLVTNYLLQGASTIPPVFEKLVSAWDSFNTQYSLNSNFWTERHAAVQLLGYVSAYEMTGSSTSYNKAANVFNTLKTMQESPVEGAPTTGALMHTAESHGEGGSHFIASPWMSAYLIDAVERYYIHFNDLDSLSFIIKMADFFKLEGPSLYEWKGWQGTDSYYVPHYLAGIDLTAHQQGNDGSLDLEHAPDAMKIFASAYFASCAISVCDMSYLSVISKLYNASITYTFPYWIRSSAPEAGLSSYRLAPPRKFNWWFKASANIDFLLQPESRLPSYKNSAPELTLTQSHDATYFSSGDSITVSYKLTNTGSSTAKNVVIFSNILKYSPNGLLSIHEVEQSGINRFDAAVWKIDTLAPGETLDNLYFTVEVKDFPTLPSVNRPIGNILSFATLYFCHEDDNEEDCRYWQSNWDTGVQTYKTQSNWQIIKPMPPVTPPTININNPEHNQQLTGLVEIDVDIIDDDGVKKVEFWLNDERLKSFSEPPYSFTIQSNALADLEHSLTVKAWDEFGSFSESTASFTVATPDKVAPSITINSPTNNTNYCEYLDVDYEVSDNYSIDYCELELDHTLIHLASCDSYRINKLIPIFKAVAYLPFEQESETIMSQDGEHLIGTPNNIIFELDEDRQVIALNGLDADINFTTTELSMTNDLTLAFWIKPSTSEGMLLSQSWDYIGNEKGWAVYLGPNQHRSNNELSISWSSGNNKINGNELNVVQTPSNSIELNVWQHIVIRKTSDEVDIFINGEQVTNQRLAHQEINWPFNSEKQLSIAEPMNHPDFYNQRYQGKLDELIMWNLALTDEEIEEIYHPESINVTKELAIYAHDKAGNFSKETATFTLQSCN